MLRLVAVLCLALAIPLAWVVADDPGRDETAPCLPADPAKASPAVIALLGGEVHRLVRISLPGGEIGRERTVGPPLPDPGDERDLFRLNVASGPALAAAPGGASVLALVRRPAPGRDSVAVVDSRSLGTRCRYSLERGVRYSGLLLGSSGSLYAFGTRRVEGTGRRDAVVSIVDAHTGALTRTQTVRRAGRGERDWFPYAGALSPDERRLILSYHGGDTTGADWFRVSAGRRVTPGGTGRSGISFVHGSVEPLPAGFVATTGAALIEVNPDGKLIRRLQPNARKVHLMDFALAQGGSLLYVSSCGKRPSLRRLHLARERMDVLPSGGFCGVPLAVHDDRLLLAATTVGKHLGYPRGPWPPEELRLVDLRDPGAGGRALTSGVPLDALVLR